jgi:hypothetical protein
MAWNMGLRYGAVNLSLLTPNTLMELDYLPTSAPYVDGNETVTETFRLKIIGTSKSDARSYLQQIDNFFTRARIWQATKSGQRVFVDFWPDGFPASARSELVDGSIWPDKEMVAPWTSGQFLILATVTITRRNWWEEDLTSPNLVNENGPATPVNVFNNNDRVGASPNKHNNYFDIAAASITGTIPADCTIILVPSPVAGSVKPTNINIDVAKYTGTPTNNTDHWWEAIVSTPTGIVNHADANRTNGDYYSNTMGVNPEWLYPNIGSEFSRYVGDFADSGFYKLYAALKFSTAKQYNAYYHIEAAMNVIASSPQLYFSGKVNYDLFDFGRIRFPGRPLVSWTGSGSMPLKDAIPYLALSDVNGITCYADYLTFVRSDYGRKLISSGISFGDANYEIVDDGLEMKSASLHQAVGGVKQVNMVAAVGQQIKLTPGMYHRFYINCSCDEATAGYYLKNLMFSAQIIYRPRRLTF